MYSPEPNYTTPPRSESPPPDGDVPMDLHDPPAPPDSMGTITFGTGPPPAYRELVTPSFLHPGRLLIIPENWSNTALRGRALVVLTTSSEGWAQCVCLCQHTDYTGGESRSVYKAHMPVFSGSDENIKAFTKRHHDPLQLVMKNKKWQVVDNCYVNLEHTWTLSNKFHVADLGFAHPRQVRTLLKAYNFVQRRMYDRQLLQMERDQEERREPYRTRDRGHRR